MLLCIPGIDATNLASIFEEHVVVSHLDPFQPIKCSFGLKDRVFNFGTLTAQLSDLLTSDSVAASPRDAAMAAKKSAKPGALARRASVGPGTGATAEGPPSPVASQKPAAPVPDTGSFLDNPATSKANLKFINPKKVACTVAFSVQPQNGHQPGACRLQQTEQQHPRGTVAIAGLAASAMEKCSCHTVPYACLDCQPDCYPPTDIAGVRFPIEVYPSTITIPAHEYRHVTLAFCPKALQQYSATFEAVAVGGAADPSTASFTCEVRAEGALPSLTFQVCGRQAHTAQMLGGGGGSLNSNCHTHNNTLMVVHHCNLMPSCRQMTPTQLRNAFLHLAQEPSGIDAAGRPWLKFGKVTSPGQSRKLLINLRNNGFLPATARIDMDPHAAFHLLGGAQVGANSVVQAEQQPTCSSQSPCHESAASVQHRMPLLGVSSPETTDFGI